MMEEPLKLPSVPLFLICLSSPLLLLTVFFTGAERAGVVSGLLRSAEGLEASRSGEQCGAAGGGVQQAGEPAAEGG